MYVSHKNIYHTQKRTYTHTHCTLSLLTKLGAFINQDCLLLVLVSVLYSVAEKALMGSSLICVGT